MTKRYKSKELYICFTLNRLVQELDIDIYQIDIEPDLDRILLGQRGTSKMEICNEIRTNHFQTNKILGSLKEKGYVSIEETQRAYIIKITKDGVLYIRKYNEFFINMYEDLIRDHYKFKKLPAWFNIER
jgi:predicted transcriptional regulator